MYQDLSTANETVVGNKTTVVSIAGDWWYLDQQGCGDYHQNDWQCSYAVNPDFATWTPAQRALMKGGETAMWGEGINAYNQDSYVWRGTGAVAERLWSPFNLTQTYQAAESRFVEQLCRLETLGVRAGPIAPGFCPQDVIMPASTTGFPPSARKGAATALGAALGRAEGGPSDKTVTVTMSKADAAALHDWLLAGAGGE